MAPAQEQLSFNPRFESVTASNILSFGEEPVTLDLRPLNILIGSNGAGKSNLVELFGLLNGLPRDLAEPFRLGGGIDQWIWKDGSDKSKRIAKVDLKLRLPKKPTQILYSLSLRAFKQRPEVVDERIEYVRPQGSSKNAYFFYRF